MGKQAKGAKQGRGGARVAALLGVAASVLVLAAGALLERTVNTVCELLVGLLDRAAGVDLRPPETHLERYLTAYQYEDRREGDGAGPGTSYQHALDEEAMLARSTFPIPPRELVGLTKNLIAADLGVPGSSPSSQHFDKRQPAKSAQGTYPSELRQIVGLPATADASMTPIGSMASRGSSDLNYSFSATGVGATGLVLGSQNYTGSSWLTAMQHGVQKPGASSLQSMKRVSSKDALSMLRVASKDSLNGQDTQWVDSLVGELDLLET